MLRDCRVADIGRKESTRTIADENDKEAFVKNKRVTHIWEQKKEIVHIYDTKK